MLAILLPYSTYQNEPSKPVPELHEIPEDEDECKELLLLLLKKYVIDYDHELVIIYDMEKNEYSDMYICADGEAFLFVTFVK